MDCSKAREYARALTVLSHEFVGVNKEDRIRPKAKHPYGIIDEDKAYAIIAKTGEAREILSHFVSERTILPEKELKNLLSIKYVGEHGLEIVSAYNLRKLQKLLRLFGTTVVTIKIKRDYPIRIENVDWIVVLAPLARGD